VILSEQEISYLKEVANEKWNSRAMFPFDHISIGLIQKGLLIGEQGRGIFWKLTDAGQAAIQDEIWLRASQGPLAR
jgi:hypothetical protein